MADQRNTGGWILVEEPKGKDTVYRSGTKSRLRDHLSPFNAEIQSVDAESISRISWLGWMTVRSLPVEESLILVGENVRYCVNRDGSCLLLPSAFHDLIS